MIQTTYGLWLWTRWCRNTVPIVPTEQRQGAAPRGLCSIPRPELNTARNSHVGVSAEERAGVGLPALLEGSEDKHCSSSTYDV